MIARLRHGKRGVCMEYPIMCLQGIFILLYVMQQPKGPLPADYKKTCRINCLCVRSSNFCTSISSFFMQLFILIALLLSLLWVNSVWLGFWFILLSLNFYLNDCLVLVLLYCNELVEARTEEKELV